MSSLTRRDQEGTLPAVLFLTPGHTFSREVHLSLGGLQVMATMHHIELERLLTSLAMSLEALAAFTDMASGVRS